MAEYYPLLSRAVAGLRDSTPETRQAIYGRARQALIGQLQGMQPPVPEEAINKERSALDDAIARLEAELTPPPSVSDAASAAVEAALGLDLLAPEPAGDVRSAAVPSGAGLPATPAPPPPVAVKPPASRVAAAPTVVRQERPAFTPRATLPPPRSARSDDTSQRPAVPAVVDAGASPPLPTASTLDDVVTKPTEDAGPAPAIEVAADPARPVEAPAIEARGREEGVRPAIVPRPAAPQPRNLRVWIVAVAALAAVVVIALTAWKLRDRPEQLVRATPAPTTQSDAAPGKIVERADTPAATDEDATEAAPAIAAPPAGAQTAAATTPTQQAATPVPPPAADTAAQPASEQAIPVSYKAAVLVAAPDTPEKVKTFVGTVVWRSETAGADGAAVTAVRADVDVPDAKLQMTMEIRKNTEAQFPASHVIDIKFTSGAGGIGAVKQIDVPQMRGEDAATGDALVGVPVTITDNSFLVGLARGEAEARNLNALRTRGWFDIPMVMADGKPAKITFEKGASGDRILADALATWNRS